MRVPVQLIALDRADFTGCDRHARFQSVNGNPPVFVGQIFAASDRRAVSVQNEERRARNGFRGIFLEFLNRENPRRDVEEREFLRVAGLNLNRLRGVVQDIPGDSPNFIRNNGYAGSEAGNHNLTVVVRHIFAAIRSDERAAAVFQQKRDSGNRLCRSVFIDLNCQRLFRNITENDGLRVVGFDFHRPRFRVQDITVRNFRFRDGINSRLDFRQSDLTVFVRAVNSVAGCFALIGIQRFAVRGCNPKLHAGDKPFRHAVPRFQDKRAFRGVIKYERLGVAVADCDGLRCRI